MIMIIAIFMQEMHFNSIYIAVSLCPVKSKRVDKRRCKIDENDLIDVKAFGFTVQHSLAT